MICKLYSVFFYLSLIFAHLKCLTGFWVCLWLRALDSFVIFFLRHWKVEWKKVNLNLHYLEVLYWSIGKNWVLFCTVQKVSIFGVFLVRIFIHSDCRDLFWKLRIQLECRKIRTRNTSNADTFYTILDTNKPSISMGDRMVVLIHSRHKNLWDALHDLVQFVKFKKAWKTPMEEYYFW